MSAYIETAIESDEIEFNDPEDAYEFCEKAFESLTPSKQAEFLADHTIIETEVTNLTTNYHMMTDVQKISFLESCNLYSSEYVNQLIEEIESSIRDLSRTTREAKAHDRFERLYSR